MSQQPRVDRDPVMKAIKDKLLGWICERHAADCPLDRHLLRDKALELAGEYGLTGFKCSDRWLARFLKNYGFSLDPSSSSGPIFDNYRFWIDAMRSVITQYKHKDLFHLDELTMYSDISPAGISSAMYHTARQDVSLKRTTVLMCCNAAGTEKSPLLICGTYPAVLTGEDHMYTHSRDASISDGLFREWLSRLNDRMLHGERKILLLLHRDRLNAFRGLELSNIRHVFFPENFPPLLRPLKRDVFHFVKMVYRSKYVEGIKDHGHRWNVENVVESLVEAWRKVPRALIVASFQRTSFRTDDCFLEIHCDAWEVEEAGVTFERFVKFDDDLSTWREGRQSTGHHYNLRTREGVALVGDESDCSGKLPIERIHDESRADGDSRKIHGKNTDRMKSSLKRSQEEARLDDEDRHQQTESNADSSVDNLVAGPSQESRSDVEGAVASPSTKRPRIINIETFYVAKEPRTDASTRDTAEFEELDPIVSKTHTDSVLQPPNDAVDRQEARSGKDEASSDDEQRSTGSLRRIDASDTNDAASQQVLDDTFNMDSATRQPNVSAVSEGEEKRRETELSDEAPVTIENDDSSLRRQSSKRKRSDSVEEPRDQTDDDEPEPKKSKHDSDWAKRYETTFVFGSSDTSLTEPTDVAGDEQQPKPKRSCETQRSIFTIRPRKD